MTGEFLNPYTFIPAYPREGLPKELDDAAPPGHDRLHAGTYTGRIGVTLTVKTPLLLLDTARHFPPEKGEPDHKVYPVRLRNGRPHIPATSIKGMLRAAYEAITNSRFGIFANHECLGFRRDAGYAQAMVPVLVGHERKVLYAFHQAKLTMYDDDGRCIYPPDRAPQHLQRLRAVVSADGTEVRDFVPIDAEDDLDPAAGEILVHGFAYVTGLNIEKKHDERLFYLKLDERPCEMPLAVPWEELEKQWYALIESYRAAHTQEEFSKRKHQDRSGLAKPDARIGVRPGQFAWSPHLYDDEVIKFDRPLICYAHLNDGKKVDGLYPVLVPRSVYPITPGSLLHKSLAPAPTYQELSPADRVFGWTAPTGTGVRPAAYRGRLRVGPVSCDQDADEAVQPFDGDGLPLAILSSPKPHQGRFYLAESAEDPLKPIEDGTKKEDLYQEGRGLRGRKAYWHHAGLAGRGHWCDGAGKVDPTQAQVGGHYREYRRPWKPVEDGCRPDHTGKRHQTTPGAEQRDSQNRSIQGWVKPDSTFRFTIDVRDLNTIELGALAWLLMWEPGYFHRLGLGRPLGFGSVRLNIDEARTELHTSDQHSEYYRSLSADLPPTNSIKILREARDAYERLIDGSAVLRTIKKAMLTVAKGDPNLAVHYPRTRPAWLPDQSPSIPDPNGKNYEWFTENERIERDRPARGRGRSLPSVLDNSTPLVAYKKECDKGGRGKSR